MNTVLGGLLLCACLCSGKEGIEGLEQLIGSVGHGNEWEVGIYKTKE